MYQFTLLPQWTSQQYRFYCNIETEIALMSGDTLENVFSRLLREGTMVVKA